MIKIKFGDTLGCMLPQLNLVTSTIALVEDVSSLPLNMAQTVISVYSLSLFYSMEDRSRTRAYTYTLPKLHCSLQQRMRIGSWHHAMKIIEQK